MDRMPSTVDLVIIGGGPAGLAVAIAARQKNISVLVVERAQGPIDKACGEGLMPDGIAALSRLGVSLPPGQTVPFRGIRFIDGQASVEAPFPDGWGLGIRRTTLHETLAKYALEAGASLAWGTKVRGLMHDGVDLGTHIVRCRWIVGADGQNSSVRKWAGLESVHLERIRFGHRRHFELVPWTDFVEVYWGESFQIVLTPVNSRLICAALVSRSARLQLDDAIALIPALSRRLTNAVPATREKGAVSAFRILRSVYREHVALAGDASGSVDSITGAGLCLAFKQAAVLAEAIAGNNLSEYSNSHRRIAGMPALMSLLLLILGRHSLLRRGILCTFNAKPRLFSLLLEAHVGRPLGPAVSRHDAETLPQIFTNHTSELPES
ncbi:MAG TPA: NAD(P)/FAD-dependent oxidoreductase [Acidobacteriota bacterium]|nr:NAD(P)/FAD-dependent oxidoreductase [Acidobacteriota bacterium]